MNFESNRIGFRKERKKNVCKTFESSTPPRFEDNQVIITESTSGARMGIDGNVDSFRKTKDGKYRIRVCKK